MNNVGLLPASVARNLSNVSIGLIVLLLVMENTISVTPQLAWFGYSIWAGIFLCIVFYAVGCLVDIARNIRYASGWACLIVCFGILSIVALRIPRPEGLSGEATQQIACFLDHFTNSADAGWKGTCMFGYPARQHFIPALPSLLWGRSLPVLQFGGSLYFFVSFIVFISGLLRWFAFSRWGNLLTATLAASLFHVYYVNHFLFQFEQSIFPFCFALLLSGLYLRYSVEAQRLLCLCIAGCVFPYLLFSYTPSLALYGCALVVLGFLLVSHTTPVVEKAVIVCLIVSSLFLLQSSLVFRKDINIFTAQAPPSGSRIEDIIAAGRHILYQSSAPVFATPLFTGVLVLFLGMCFLGAWGWKQAMVAYWVAGVGILSVISKGYSYYSIEFRLHRATVTIPVVITPTLTSPHFS